MAGFQLGFTGKNADESVGGCCAGTPPSNDGVALPNCFCNVPKTVKMTSANESCNYGMFRSCSLTYGPPPPAMQALNFTANVFTSSAMFVDQVTDASFFYYFNCRTNQFFLTRIFPESPMGSPFRDAILYTWNIGAIGNTCVPFAMPIGVAFAGSDASCSVSLSG